MSDPGERPEPAFDDSGPVGSEEPLADPHAIEAALDVEGGADELARTSTSGAQAVVGRWQSPAGRLLRSVLAFVAFFLIVAVIWELLKWLFGDPWRFPDILGTGVDYFHRPPFELIQANDLQLPHIWDIAYSLTEPALRRSESSLLVHLVRAAASTWSAAVIGFAFGALIGIVLASIFVHSLFAERAIMPYVIASQAVPIVALAPIIVVAAGRGSTSVIIIATYLTFFPVTIAQARGLRSADRHSLELMRSYAASRWDIYRKVRFPASLPYLFTALKIAAAAAIVGAIIGEGPGGVKDGLGRNIINYSQQYITGPEKLWATILIAALTGILFFMAVRIAEIITLRRRGASEPRGSSRHGHRGRLVNPERSGTPAVRLSGVEKSFPVKGGEPTVALTDIELQIASREFVSLIGPSGCGKSTLLRIVGDLIEPTHGTVEVNGKPAAQARRDREYGMVFQAPVLFDWRTVEANVRLPLEVTNVSKRERDALVREKLELVELGGFLGYYPHQLSGGMQQRVAIARALALQPSLLLMDEPFGALDEMTRERLNGELLRIWSQTGTTIIFVTHSIPEAVFLSTRVVVMSPRPGRIAETIDIDLPHPRDETTREVDRYYELVTEVREALRGRPGGGASAAASRTRAEGSFG